jgi:hypothetical protein
MCALIYCTTLPDFNNFLACYPDFRYVVYAHGHPKFFLFGVVWCRDWTRKDIFSFISLSRVFKWGVVMLSCV